jgi:DNA-binding winged helix-turn-helix (wHTH) protein
MEAWMVIPELNRLQNKLTNQGRSIEPRLIQLLCFLAANESVVLSRDCLVEQLWPDVIVNENSLTRAVSELRKQLRDGCRRGVIETIPKRGYRLVCKIESTQGPSSKKSPTVTPSEPLHSAFPGAALYERISMAQAPKAALVAITLAALLGASVSINLAGSPVNTSASRQNSLITIPTVLKDEILIKEQSYLGGQFALSSIDEQEISNQSATRPVLSHDGSSYAYLRYDQNGSTIFVGTLNESSNPCAIYQTPEKLVNLAWSPVGQSLLFAKKMKLTTAALFSNNQTESQLMILDVASGMLKRLVEEGLPKNNHMMNESSLT